MKSHAQSWNRVMKLLTRAQEAWEKHREVALQRPSLAGLDPKTSKTLALPINKYEFDFAIQEFPLLWKHCGGPAGMLVPVNKEEEGSETI